MKSRQRTSLAVVMSTMALVSGTAACSGSGPDGSTGSRSTQNGTAIATPAPSPAREIDGNPRSSASASATPERVQPRALPAFLTVADLPLLDKGDRWTAYPVTDGRPDDYETCDQSILPASRVQYRRFTTEVADSMTQVVVRTGNEAAAKDLVARLEQAMSSCGERRQRQDPDSGTTYTSEHYGDLAVEDGAAVYGFGALNPAADGGEEGGDEGTEREGGNLWGVGRDRETVTLTTYQVYGGPETAPVDDFKKTTATSVTKLYG